MALFRFTPRRCRELQVSPSATVFFLPRVREDSPFHAIALAPGCPSKIISRLFLDSPRSKFEIRGDAVRDSGDSPRIPPASKGNTSRVPAILSSIDRCATRNPPVREIEGASVPPNSSIDGQIARVAAFVSGDCSLPRGGFLPRLSRNETEITVSG